MTRALAVVAATFGILMGMSPILQIRRMIARRSSSDVSLAYFGVLAVGFVLWLSYGIAIDNAPLIVTNVVAVTVAIATISVAIALRRREGSSATDGAAGAS